MNQLLPQSIIESLYGGHETLSFLSASTIVPNLILIDNNLEEIDGLPLMRVIRGNDHFADVPVLILTSKPEHQNRSCVEGGAAELGWKPLPSQADALAGKIREKWFISVLNQKNMNSAQGM
jgi:CheY-like chemotaxis protein